MTDEGRLRDRAAIHDLVWGFGEAVNRNDAAAFARLWHPSGCWQSDPPANLDARGIEQLSAIFRELMGQWAFFHHIAQPGPVHVEGDRARCASGVQEFGIFSGGDTLRTYGRYDDELVRTAQGWRFERRYYSFRYIDAPVFAPQFIDTATRTA